MNPNILPKSPWKLKNVVGNMQLLTFPVHPPQRRYKVCDQALLFCANGRFTLTPPQNNPFLLFCRATLQEPPTSCQPQKQASSYLFCIMEHLQIHAHMGLQWFARMTCNKASTCLFMWKIFWILCSKNYLQIIKNIIMWFKLYI